MSDLQRVHRRKHMSRGKTSQTSHILSRGYIFASLILLTISVSSISILFSLYEPKEAEEDARVASVVDVHKLEKIDVEAHSFVVYDIATKEFIFGKNETEVLPLASITKTMTALTACEYRDKINEISISESDLETEGSSVLIPDSSWKLIPLLQYMMTVSSNDAAVAIARNVGKEINIEHPYDAFIEKMNSNAKLFGMHTAVFSNPSGLDIDTKTAGAYASARDVARLFAETRRCREAFETTTTNSAHISEGKRVYTVENTNYFADKTPGLVASKTGFTDLAGGNLAVRVDRGLGQDIIVVVLGSTREARFKDTSKILEALARR